VVAALERHTGAGRLTLEEFEARVGVACGARTLDELAAVTSDLPATVDDEAMVAEPDEGSHRELLLLFLIAAVTLVLLAVGLALR
jgi:hypothetical protein